MSEPDLAFEVLRGTIEPELRIPAVVVVTAAFDVDGAAFVSAGLAIAYADAQVRTILIDAAPSGDAIAVALGFPQLPSIGLDGTAYGTYNGQEYFSAYTLSCKYDQLDFERQLAPFIESLKMHYEVIILHLGPLLKHPFLEKIMSLSDGALVSIKLGRHQKQTDLRAAAVLNEIGAPILGMVTTTGKAQRRLFQIAPPTREMCLLLTQQLAKQT